ncbi:MAG: outer membrane protein assembly factor BamA [Pelagibacteraceae bacterium]|nr:outer membrane protein assembly factor BamA [Pelagibacteraceae bacterium]
MKKILLILVIISIPSFSYGLSQKKIVIKGNEYIDDEAIYSIIEGDFNLSSDADKNKIIKSLYNTGNFKNILIEEKEESFIISVEENPKIEKVSFNGIKRFEEKEIFEFFNKDEYFKFYNNNSIDQFINEFKKIYYSFGYNQIHIEYDIIDHQDKTNFVNLDFKISEGKISKINRIYFIGNNYFDKNELLSEIKSKPDNFILILRNANFKKYQIKNDVNRLSNLYKNNGFKHIKVTYKTEYISSNNTFNVYFYIDEGLHYDFNLFHIDTQIENINLDQIEHINTIVNDYYLKNISKKNFYNESKINKLTNIISDYLYDIGLIFFEIQVLENIEDTNVDILYKIIEVQPKYVDQINIFGNTRTIEKVIRREITVAEGDAINSDKIRTSNNNLKRLDIFRNVSIEEKSGKDNYVDLDVNVEEKSTGEFNVGISVGSYEGINLVSGLREKNFGGSGRLLDLSVNTSENKTNYNFDITEPYIFNRNLSFIYGINYSEFDYGESSSYDVTNFTTKSGFNYLLSEDLNHKIILEYSLKDYTITDSSTASSNIKDLEGGNADIYLKNSLIYNKLNSFIRPTNGTYINFNNSFSPITNSDNGSIKNTLTYRKYFKYDSNIFSIQSKIGNISSLQNTTIPSDEKFSLGGRWLRGFDTFGAGPRDSRTSYIGGNNLIVSKLDFQRPIFKNAENPIDFNLFLDAGVLFGNKNDPTNSTESIRSSYGFGIKWYTIIGPIGFNWGFPISSESYDIERMFIFTIGNVN